MMKIITNFMEFSWRKTSINHEIRWLRVFPITSSFTVRYCVIGEYGLIVKYNIVKWHCIGCCIPLIYSIGTQTVIFLCGKAFCYTFYVLICYELRTLNMKY